MEDKINELIFRLRAMLMVLKSEHYYDVGYESHLLADRLIDEIGGEDVLDSLKEQGILAFNKLPLQAREYLEGAMKYVFDMAEDNRANWIKMIGLLDETRKFINEIHHPDRGVNALLDNIAQGLCTASALLYIHTRRTDRVNENVEHDHTAATETPIDRKEFEEVIPTPSIAQEIGLKQSAEVAALGENAIDKLADKIKELGL